MDLRIVVKGPSERELRRTVKQAALLEARKQYPDMEIVIDQQSLDKVTRDIYKPIKDIVKKFK